jgi:hypothetical protein
LPLPELPEVTVSHVVLLLDAVQEQPPGATTVTEPEAVPGPGVAPVGLIPYVQAVVNENTPEALEPALLYPATCQ